MDFEFKFFVKESKKISKKFFFISEIVFEGEKVDRRAPQMLFFLSPENVFHLQL